MMGAAAAQATATSGAKPGSVTSIPDCCLTSEYEPSSQALRQDALDSSIPATWSATESAWPADSGDSVARVENGDAGPMSRWVPRDSSRQPLATPDASTNSHTSNIDVAVRRRAAVFEKRFMRGTGFTLTNLSGRAATELIALKSIAASNEEQVDWASVPQPTPPDRRVSLPVSALPRSRSRSTCRCRWRP